jgi:hypothetical protein
MSEERSIIQTFRETISKLIHSFNEKLKTPKNDAIKAIVVKLIDFAYLMSRLIESVLAFGSGSSSAQQENNYYLQEMENLTYKLLDVLAILVPLFKFVIPGSQLTLLLVVLAYRLNLFRKTLRIVRNETIGLIFRNGIVPLLNMLHISGVTFIQSRL